MRESIGGGWIMGIVVLFIVLFSGYLAISVNYSKAFKVKNKILSVIEQREGYTKALLEDNQWDSIGDPNSGVDINQSAQTEIYAYLKEVGYFDNVIKEDYCSNNDLGTYQKGGFCLKRIQAETGSYYKVTTFLKIEFPVIDFVMKVPISGETKVIYYDVGSE